MEGGGRREQREGEDREAWGVEGGESRGRDRGRENVEIQVHVYTCMHVHVHAQHLYIHCTMYMYVHVQYIYATRACTIVHVSHMISHWLW